MRALVRLVALRHLRAARGRTLLTLLGIVLGVAVVFAVDVVNASVLRALRESMTGVAGKARLTVGGGVGVEESVLESVRAVPGVAAAVPIIQASVYDVNSHTQLAVLAADTLSDPNTRGYDVTGKDARVDDVFEFLNDPNGVLVTEQYAARTGVEVGGTLTLDTVLGRVPFTIHGTLRPTGPASVYGGDLLLMDVYAAQIAFARGRRFDRIDVIPQAGTDLHALTVRLEHALAGKAAITTAEQRTQESQRLLGGFQLALSLASLIAIFVGGFIVYNALAISVARRRREIGILRALGTTRRQVLLLFVSEGLLLGVVGAALGLCVGWLLAQASLRAVANTISTLFVPVAVEGTVIPAHGLAIAAGLGIAAAVVAAFVPARRAGAVEPVAALSGTVAVADVMVGTATASLRAALVLLAAAGLAAWAAHAFDVSWPAYLVAGSLSFASMFFAPALARAVGVLAQRATRRIGPSALLGAVGFARNTGRNAVATAALGMALANVVTVDALIDSLKSGTDAWLARSFRADVFVFAGTDVQAKFARPLPASLRDDLAELPRVRFVQAFRMAQQSFRGQPFYLMSEDLEGYRRFNELAVVEGDGPSALDELEAGTAVGASEAFARSFGVGVGDVVTLQTPEGPRGFRVAVVYADYRSDIGILLTDREVYTRLFRDSRVDLYGVYLEQGSAAEPVRAAIARRWGGRYGLLALGSTHYRRELVGLVDRSMALSRATELVAVVVAALGIVNALLVGVIDRRREIGVLKAIGAVRSQLGRMVLTESFLIAGTAALLGVVLGTALSAYMVIGALPLQVGWKLAFRLAPGVIAETFVAAALLAWVSAWIPTRWVTRLPVGEALAYE